MAEVHQLKQPPPISGGPDDKDHPLLKQMRKLVVRAEMDRRLHQGDISECYRYTMPWRHGFGASTPTDQKPYIFDTTGQTVLEDFAADMLNTFTPQRNNWVEERPIEYLDEGEKNQIRQALEIRQLIVFAEMGRSNLYQALQEAYYDLGPGTMHLVIQDMDPAQPIHCEAIPSTDKLITRGPFGMIDGHFRKKRYLRSEVKVLWPDAKPYDQKGYPGYGETFVEGSEGDEVEITDGCWRDWADRANETYHYLVEAQGKIIYQMDWKGAGSCPFVTARWARDSTTAWGVGPTYRELPNIKTLQHVRYLSLKNYDKHVDPVTAYNDDGVANLDHGVTPGTWIPIGVGSEMPQAIESKARFDVEVFERDELRSAIKRAHYQDRPEQLGKTPPTAFQWADERAERARRMGTPATNLVQELQYPIYRRFVYLLEERGVIAPIYLNDRVVSLQPSSPLLRAQEQEEVIRLDRFAEMIGARFGPQIAMVVIDILKYSHRLAGLLGVDEELLRDEEQITNAIQQLMPVLQSFGGAQPGQIPTPPLPIGAMSGAEQGAV